MPVQPEVAQFAYSIAKNHLNGGFFMPKKYGLAQKVINILGKISNMCSFTLGHCFDFNHFTDLIGWSDK